MKTYSRDAIVANSVWQRDSYSLLCPLISNSAKPYLLPFTIRQWLSSRLSECCSKAFLTRTREKERASFLLERFSWYPVRLVKHLTLLHFKTPTWYIKTYEFHMGLHMRWTINYLFWWTGEWMNLAVCLTSNVTWLSWRAAGADSTRTLTAIPALSS